jgi:hypothetical protein
VGARPGTDGFKFAGAAAGDGGKPGPGFRASTPAAPFLAHPHHEAASAAHLNCS